MTKLNPFLRFNDGKCLEAMNFYKDIFGGTFSYMTIGESPMASEVSADKQNLIMHSELSNKDLTFYGSDMMRDVAIIGDNVGMSLNCKSETELRNHFDKLAQGGEIFMAPEKQFWGGLYGMVTDKYGVEWMLNYQIEPYKMPERSKSSKTK